MKRKWIIVLFMLGSLMPISSGTHWNKGIPLIIKSTRAVTAPDVYATGIALGALDASAGLELVMASGSDLNNAPIDGTVTCWSAAGASLWTYNSATNDYALGVAIGDIDNDADYEILVGFHIADHIAVLLNNAGGFVWSFDNGADNYVRSVDIGELDSGHAGKEAVIGGRNGTLHLLDKDGASIWSKTGGTSLSGGVEDANPSFTTVQGIDIADTDIDGQSEILVAYSKFVRKYDYTGTQTWSTTVGDDSYAIAWDIAAGNVTSDTGLEIAVAVGSIGASTLNAVKLLDKDGNVLWTKNMWMPVFSVAIADVNGDGQNEIIAGFGQHVSQSPPALYGGGIAILDKTGGVMASFYLPSSVKFVIFGDADNDGNNEIIASCDDSKVYIIGVG